MLKKWITLATATAMLGANAAAQAIGTARAAFNSLTGASAAGEEAKPGDGTKILPSIPPMPPIEKAEPVPRKPSGKKAATDKPAKAGKVNTKIKAKAMKPRSRTSSSSAKATPRKAKHTTRHASK